MTPSMAPVAVCLAASTMNPPLGNFSVNHPPTLSPSARKGANGSNQPPPSPPSADAGKPPIYDNGFTGLPPVQDSKCKCGPVELPVLPDRPITGPFATSPPGHTIARDK